MDKNIINAPEFSSSILPYLNYAENYGPSLEVLMDLLNANEKIITIYRIINDMPRFVKNAEAGKSESGVSDKAILNEIVKGDSIFCATGITAGDLVNGIKIDNNKFITETLVTHKKSSINIVKKEVAIT